MAPQSSTGPRFVPHHQIGRTGFRATRAGIGDLADPSAPFERSVRTLQRALDAGLNVIDTAPNYENGLSEQLVGAAIEGRRDELFVVDKIDHLDRPVAPQIEASLGRLRLTMVDLFVFHAIHQLEQWQSLIEPGGGFDQLEACARAGLARFRGISCHDPDVLELALRSGLCDVVMFPLGPYVDPRYLDPLLPLARRLGVGTIAFKTFGAGKLLADTTGYGQPMPGQTPSAEPRLPRLSVDECVRFTLTYDPDVTLLGLSNAAEQDAAFAAIEQFTPLTENERAEVGLRARHAIEGKGPCWWNPQ